MCAHYLYEGNIKTNHRRADFIFTFAMRYCKQTSDEDQMLEGVKMSPATSRLLNSQTGIVSQRILQFFEISDLKVVTMICVGAQIMSDYDRLM